MKGDARSSDYSSRKAICENPDEVAEEVFLELHKTLRPCSETEFATFRIVHNITEKTHKLAIATIVPILLDAPASSCQSSEPKS